MGFGSPQVRLMLASMSRPVRWLLSGWTLAAGTFLVYLRTLAPGVSGFDSAEFATGAYTLGIVHPPGYPLYLIIARLFILLPWGDVANRVNVMSAAFGTLTVLLLYKLVRELTGRLDVAWAASAFFAFTNYFWAMSLVAEVYTLHTFFLASNLLLLAAWRRSGDDRFLLAFAFMYGLSLSNHVGGVLFLPGFAWLAVSSAQWHRIGPRRKLPLPLLLLLGLAPYAYLPVRAMAVPPLNYVGALYNVDLTSPSGIWWMVSGQAYRFFAFGYDWPHITGEFLRFLGYLWRNFLGIGVVLGAIGVASMWRRDRTRSLGLLLVFAAQVVFYVNYRVMDKDTMFLPAYLVWAVFVGEGFRLSINWADGIARSGSLLPAFRTSLTALFVALAPIAALANFEWVDMSSNAGPRIFAEGALDSADQGAMIIAPWSSAVVLEYYQIVEGRRPDLLIYNRSRSQVARYYQLWEGGVSSVAIRQVIADEERRMLEREIGRRPVYMVEYDPLFESEYEYLPAGGYFELRLRDG